MRDLRDLCVTNSVPFFLKQWGTNAANPTPSEQELDPKAKGGATLDGRLWREFPTHDAQRRPRHAPPMPEDHPDAHELPTPRSTLQARHVAVLLSGRSCLRSTHADLQALIAAGHGDAPLVDLRWRCSHCRSRLVDFVVTNSVPPFSG